MAAARTAPAAPPPALLLTAVLLALLPSLPRAATEIDGDEPFEVICPADPDSESNDPQDSEYCECVIKKVGVSRILQVKCNFNNEKDVILTKRIYAIRTTGFSSAYVRISNARSVIVTRDFMKEWQEALSSALDIWHSGPVALSPSPEIYKKKSFKTFVGIGIINCQLEIVPSKLLRDHHRGALRIKESTIGTVQPGVIHNIDELRYLVMEDCLVVRFEGAISTTIPLTLSSRELHTWNGLLFNNVTVDFIAAGAFNLTHMLGPEEVVVKNSHIGDLGTGGLVVTGAISLNITGNTFDILRQDAIQANIDQKLAFSSNTLLKWEEGAIAGMQCPEVTNNNLNDNTIAMPLKSAALFHPTCGTPKVLVTTDPTAAEMVSQDTNTLSSNTGGGSTTTVVVLLLLVVALCGGAAGTWWWRSNRMWMRSTLRDTPLFEDQDQPDSVPTSTNTGGNFSAR